MAKKMTSVTVKNEVRKNVVPILKKMLIAEYGEDKVFQVGASEFAAIVAESSDGEPIYATFSPMVKDYQRRKTPKNEFFAYDGLKEQEKYFKEKAEKEQKAEDRKKLNAEIYERNKKAREQARQQKEEKKKQKEEIIKKIKQGVK